MTDKEAANLRAYLEKGGFLIVDDFKVRGGFGGFGRRATDDTGGGGGLEAFEAHVFRGLFENNDPSKRLMVVVNCNTDISQYWEWSGRGLRPFDDTNEAYKLGINYLIYGLTH